MPSSQLDASSWPTHLSDTAERFATSLIAKRRHLHQHPELSLQEFRTTEFLAEAMEELGVAVRFGSERRGLIADFQSDPSSHSGYVALRGDIDALPIEDLKQVDYQSKTAGVMHACGHDVHATIVCGAMQVLTAMHHDKTLPWPINVRAIFQPAEEVAAGAKQMLADGAIEGVDAILALHVDPSRSVGRVGLKAGMLSAACDMVHVNIQGRGGHGARPHLCIDPIAASVSWIQSAYTRLGRTLNPHETVVFSIGQIEAGHSPNVIPETSTFAGSLRSLDAKQRELALQTLQQVSDSIAMQTGCVVKMELGVSAPAVINDEFLIGLLGDSAVRVLSPSSAEPITETSMGSEDFSYYLQHIPGAMFRLGVAGPTVGGEPLHTPAFDIDEAAIPVGVKLFAGAVIQYFDPARLEVQP